MAWNDTTNKEHDMMGKNWKQPVVRILKFMIRQRMFDSGAVIPYAMSLISFFGHFRCSSCYKVQDVPSGVSATLVTGS